MRKVIFTESQIKNVIKKYINEIEKYTPSIDSPEDEEKLKKSWGIKEKDPYKMKDPFKTLKSDEDFYDTKMDDIILKQKLKQTEFPKSLMTRTTGEDRPKIDVYGHKKTSDKSPYYDKFKDQITKDDDYTPAKSNPINTPPTKKNKPITPDLKKNFKNRVMNDLQQIIDDGQLMNSETIKSAVIKIKYDYPEFFNDPKKESEFNELEEYIIDVLKNNDDDEMKSKIKSARNYLFKKLNKSTSDLIHQYSMNRKFDNRNLKYPFDFETIQNYLNYIIYNYELFKHFKNVYNTHKQ